MRPGEIICGSSIIGILNQCTLRIGLNQAAVRMHTEDGTLVVEVEDLIVWAIQNYKTLMANHLEKLYQDEDENLQHEEGEGQENEGEGQDDVGEGPDKKQKRILAYPNGESVERATYIWGESFQQLFDSATMRLNLWQPAKRFFTMEGKEISKFSKIQKDELVCVSMGKPFKPGQTSRLDIEIKANWSRAHKQYGFTSTDVHVEAATNSKVNVDPFGPPALALPNGESGTQSTPSISSRPKSAKAK